MPAAARHILVLLLMLAQVALGPSAGGVVCMGGAADGCETDSACDHASDHGGVHLPAPVEPHDDHEDDCPCIDILTPIARAGDERPDAALDAPALVLFVAPFDLPPRPALPRPVILSGHPPGPEPGCRTTRLIL